jgi:hypothetical protein
MWGIMGRYMPNPKKDSDMALDNRFRATLHSSFAELQENWAKLGVHYATELRRREGLRGTWYVTTVDEDGTAVAALPGFADLSNSPITANTILRAAVQATRMVLMSPDAPCEIHPRRAARHLTVVRNVTGV